MEMWSPASCDDLIEQEESDGNTSIELNIVNAGTPPSTSIVQTDKFTNRPLNVKRKLSFVVEQNSLPVSSKLQEGPESASNNVIYTSSSPFKVTHEENKKHQSYSPLLQPFQMESTSVNKKVTNSFDSSIPSSQSAEKDKVLELLYKMNRTMYNIKYDIMSLSDKIELLQNSGNYVLGLGELSTEEDNFQKDVFENLPLKSEEDLSIFENKLSNKEFRKKITFELKRYAKDSLPSTVRTIMRFLFKDKLLNKFSYKGQKGKKVFYTLTICSVIFDSIKLMKKFCKYDTIEAEKPLSIFISGAKFRDLPKTKTAQSVNVFD